MKALCWGLLILLCTPVDAAHLQQALVTSAVTYELNSGRLGDNLLTYGIARWISYKYGLPFLYVPFEYSEYLRLHETDPVYDAKKAKRSFKNHVFVKSR